MGLHWFDPFGSTDFDDLVNVPPIFDTGDLQLIFWDQEPVYKENAKKFFDQYVNTYHPKWKGPIVLITSEKNSNDVQWLCDTYGITTDYYFFHGWAALDWYRGYDHSYLSLPLDQRTYRYPFMCPNNIVGGNRIHRIRFFAELAQRDLVEKALISFPDKCPYEDRTVADLARDNGIDLPPVTLPRIIDFGFNHAGNSHRIDFWDQAQQAFAHVVTETLYNSDRLHLTEKTFKPIVMKQPFLLVAPRGSLAYLKSYGFRTFDSVWDESYDHLGDSARIGAVANICQDLSTMTSQQLSDMAKKTAEIVQHNHDWFYGGFQDLLWSELESMLKKWQ